MAQVIDVRECLLKHVADADGSPLEKRVYGSRIPEKPSFPCGSISVISDSGTYLLSGRRGSSRYRLQVDVISDNEVQASRSANWLVSFLDGYRGTMGDLLSGRVIANLISDAPMPDQKLFRRLVNVEIYING